MIYKVIDTIKTCNMFETGDRVIVALSGGADSVCLLDVLYKLKEEYKLTLYAAHVNHCLRGEESLRDEDFAGRLCEKYNIPLFVKTVDVARLAETEKISTELCGRNARYSFFSDLMLEKNAKTATAHTASDNTETALYHLARGTGLKGMGGIPPVRGGIVRPLIHITREQIEEYCEKNNLEYVTDSSNLSDAYTRNKIRHSVIPVLKEINGGLEETVLRFNRQAKQVDDFMTAHAGQELERCKTAEGYRCDLLGKLHPAVLGYGVRELLRVRGVLSVTEKQITLCTEIIKRTGAVELSGGFTAVSSQNLFRIVNNRLVFEPFMERYVTLLLENQSEIIYNKKIYQFNLETAQNATEKNHCVSTSAVGQNTLLRTRKAGDRFQYPKGNGSKSLKKLLIDLKVPKEKRDSLLLMANENTVLWMEGIGVSKHAAAKKQGEAVIKITVTANN